MITPAQIRAARNFLGLSQTELAQVVGKQAVWMSGIEKGAAELKAGDLDTLIKFFEVQGLEFKNGGVIPVQNLITTYEGTDCYLDFLNDAHSILAPYKGEILFSGSDETRSPEHIIEKFRNMRKDGIPMRSLLKEGDRFYMGNTEEYRCMNADLFVDTDVKIIYKDRVAWLASWLGTPRVIMIQDDAIAKEARRIFEFVWTQSDTPAPSTSEVRF